MNNHPLAGIYVAALTPLNDEFKPDLAVLPHFLDFLARRGAHGALLLGTTGEGPSFSTQERLEIFRSALAVRQAWPHFRLLAGTGTPSLEETIALTHAAFDLGFEAVVVLPPYYFRSVSDEGLLQWFDQVLRRAVPEDGSLFGYHFPTMSGVPFSLDLLKRLKDAHPHKFTGIKDSSSDPLHLKKLKEIFHDDFVVLVGNDLLLNDDSAPAGAITALANLVSPDLRKIWDARQLGEIDQLAQARVSAQRLILQKYPPYAPTLKAILAQYYDFPHWPVRLPLLPLSTELAKSIAAEMSAVQV